MQEECDGKADRGKKRDPCQRGDDQLIFFAHRSKTTEKLFSLKPIAKSPSRRRFVAPLNRELAHIDQG
jgi:hypothetical protein